MQSQDELRKKLLGLRTRRDLATLLAVPYARLAWYLYVAPPSKRYTTFKIPKRAGGIRNITAPVGGLKMIQRKLNRFLQATYEPKPSVHGFVPRRSIVSNAKVHRNRKYVFNVDLEGFFPSINFGRVRGLFMAVPYELNEEVATAIAQICCFNNQLPQGAPTSPIISNMICARMDTQLQRLAKANKCVYTRYADDMTFSTSESQFPDVLATPDSKGPAGRFLVGTELEEVITTNGFSVNRNKV